MTSQAVADVVRYDSQQAGAPIAAHDLRRTFAKLARKMSTADRLTLNGELLELPRSAGEYAIVHELVHLLAPNHGKVFKSFMHAYLRDWEERERILSGNVMLLTRQGE